jgi:hypothetical protein
MAEEEGFELTALRGGNSVGPRCLATLETLEIKDLRFFQESTGFHEA